jgi:hypothetical protein
MKARRRNDRLPLSRDRLMQDCFEKDGFARIDLAAFGMKTADLRSFKTRETGTRYVHFG